MSALDNLDVLEYRVTQLEGMLKPLMTLVNDLERKLALLAQKMVIATMLIGVVVNGIGVVVNSIGVWYGANASKTEQSTQVSSTDSDKIKAIQAELDKLRAQQSQPLALQNKK